MGIKLSRAAFHSEALFILSSQPKSSFLARENCTTGHTSWLLPGVLPKEQVAGPPRCPPLHMLPSTQGAGSSPAEPVQEETDLVRNGEATRKDIH